MLDKEKRLRWMRNWRNKNRLKLRAQATALYWKNPELFRAKNREGYLKQKAKGFDFRSKALRRLWGLTHAQYEELLHQQGGCCAICGTTNPKGRGHFHIDHDHATGRRRGLLCHNCNLMLGQARDSKVFLANAITYLDRYAPLGDAVLNDTKDSFKC